MTPRLTASVVAWGLLLGPLVPNAAAKGKAAPRQESEAAPPARRYDGWTLHEYGHHRRPQQLDVSLGGGLNNAGLALWYAIPVLPDGFIPEVNDALAIEVGTLFALYRGGFYWQPAPSSFAITLSGGLRWDLHMTHDWTTFIGLKLAVNFGFGPYDPGWIWPGFGIGALYRLNDDLELRLELGFPLGLSFGLTFDFPTL